MKKGYEYEVEVMGNGGQLDIRRCGPMRGDKRIQKYPASNPHHLLNFL